MGRRTNKFRRCKNKNNKSHASSSDREKYIRQRRGNACNGGTNPTDPSIPNPGLDFIYDLHSSTLLILLIVVSCILAVIGLLVFKYFAPRECFESDSNATTGIFIGIISIPIGVILSFIVAGVWGTYQDAAAKTNNEAFSLLYLYKTLGELPGTEHIQEMVVSYTEYIIDVEFPAAEEGIVPIEGFDRIIDIGDQVYAYNPETPTDAILYEEAIALYNSALSNRSARISAVSDGLAPELWWVLILGVIIIIIMTWFISSGIILHIILTIFITAGLVSLLFLIVALNYPFRGDFGLQSDAFSIALFNMC